MSIFDKKFETVILEKTRFCIQQEMNKRRLGIANLEVDVSPHLERLVFRLTAMLLNGPKKERIDIEERYPADWWQAVKERWFPAWAIKRWPVNYKVISVHKEMVTRMCPHIATPENRPHVAFLMEREELP